MTFTLWAFVFESKSSIYDKQRYRNQAEGTVSHGGSVVSQKFATCTCVMAIFDNNHSTAEIEESSKNCREDSHGAGNFFSAKKCK